MMTAPPKTTDGLAPVAVVCLMIAGSVLLFACLALLWRAEVEMVADPYPRVENTPAPSPSTCDDNLGVVCVESSRSRARWM